MKHNIKRITELLATSTKFSAHGIYYFEQIESTNSWLLAHNKPAYQAQSGSQIDGQICLTEKQIAGRGRHGKSWNAPPSSSVLLSMGWSLPKNRHQGLSLVSGLAVVQSLQELGVTGVKLKWPNDVIAEGKKLGGILVEISGLECVIGVGINVNIRPDWDMQIEQPWTDLYSLGCQIDRDQLVVAIVLNHERLLSCYADTGFVSFVDRWNALHAYQHQEVEVVSFGNRLSGIACGVDEQGALLVEADGATRRIVSGVVSVRAKKNHQ